MKKILGYIFIVVAIILFFALLVRLPQLFVDLYDLLKAITGNLDTYEITKALTKIILNIGYIAITLLLWIYGRQWTQKTKN